MDRKSAVAAAGAMVLVIAGGTSALVAAQTPIPGSTTTTPTTAVAQEPTVLIEYVDEAGNPVPAPTADPTTEIRTYSVDREIVIPSDAQPEVIWVDVAVPATAADGSQGTYGDDDDRYERGDDDRYEGGDDDRYEGGDDDRYEGGDDDRYEGGDDD